MVSPNANSPNPSKPSNSASCTPISLDDEKIPVDSGSKDPSILPLTSRHTSSVWTDFSRKRVGDAIKYECNHFPKHLAGGRRVGTTHLKDHLKFYPKQICQDIRQTRFFGVKVNPTNKTLTLAPSEFHQEDGRRDLEKMIIFHEYPISMVEHYGF
ncbi:hypothetical protein ES332_D03G077200v1 [Gossypium tomentosum]|uniref:BED-type domain-containing protein n=1 Tax=Gossypium tomentosum TaxID=34277 RepID=A0A5D2LK78_GOSTO|nr:hypothetical protein ES332_D03G077200v1 [Gossypium tomentosum]